MFHKYCLSIILSFLKESKFQQLWMLHTLYSKIVLEVYWTPISIIYICSSRNNTIFHTLSHFLATLYHTTIFLLYLDYVVKFASVYFTFRKCVIFFYPTLSESKLYTCLYKPKFYRHNKRTFLSIFLVAEYSRRRKKTSVYTARNCNLMWKNCILYGGESNAVG